MFLEQDFKNILRYNGKGLKLSIKTANKMPLDGAHHTWSICAETCSLDSDIGLKNCCGGMWCCQYSLWARETGSICISLVCVKSTGVLLVGTERPVRTVICIVPRRIAFKTHGSYRGLEGRATHEFIEGRAQERVLFSPIFMWKAVS